MHIYKVYKFVSQTLLFQVKFNKQQKSSLSSTFPISSWQFVKERVGSILRN